MGALLASICWFLWKAHNKTHFEGQGWDGIRLLEKASALCSEFKEATVSSRSSSGISSTASPPRWRLSPAGVINKFNVDGAVG